MEDVDLSYRAKINGYKNLFCPDSVVYHIGSATSGSRYNKFKVKLAARNNVWTVYKNFPIPQKISLFEFHLFRRLPNRSLRLENFLILRSFK